MHVTFDSREEIAPQIYTFSFKHTQPVSFVAGQFIELTIPHDHVDSRGVKRWFTISSSPNDELLQITTRISEDSSSFKQALLNLKKGEDLFMAEPMGDFVLPQDASIPLVFVAAGVGITPFHSILRHLHQTDLQRDISLIYAVATEDDILFQDTFDKAGIHATIVVKNPSPAWGGERGILTSQHILKIAEPSKDAMVYLAGPESFVEHLTKDLQNQNDAPQRIVTDFFPGYEQI